MAIIDEGRRARALMVLGTASHVGKSVLATAFCRLLAERGVRVAPFKAQNMALNSYVTRDGGEIGRAQVAQAEAAGIEPTVEMNPVLLKPMGGVSQVVVEGSPLGVMSAREYYAAKDTIWPRVVRSYDRLARSFEAIVLEGAGSPVEINLTAHDLTNLRMARHADASVVLVADIERGGVFAQLIGTWELMEPEDRRRVIGFIINKFRGDVSLLEPGLEFLRARTGVPVLGVIPYRAEIEVDQEDSLGLDETATPGIEPLSTAATLDVVVVRLPHISNFTDFQPLSRVPGVRVRYVDKPSDLGRPALVILPGTKATVHDLDWLRESRLADVVLRLADDPEGPMIVGICGGFQMLGRTIDDPLGVESSRSSTPGLGLVAMSTRFALEKNRHRVSGHSLAGGCRVVGYEIHMGETTRAPTVAPWFELTRERTGETVLDGVFDPLGRVFGTYIHGLFDSMAFTAGLVARLRTRAGLPPLEAEVWEEHRARAADRYGTLANLLREHLDLKPVWGALRLPPERDWRE
jgi:adenosylcobyric acid synthase